MRTDPRKTECIRQWPEPSCVKDVRSFLGLCGYYRRFIYKYAEIAKPLHQLTEKKRPFQWTDDCSKAFLELKTRLITSPILAYPDFSKSFILDTDASNFAISAVLSQEVDGDERPVAYASRTLNKSETKYCITRKELLAVVNYVKYYRHYLIGKPFLNRTDHGSLRWLMISRIERGRWPDGWRHYRPSRLL